jgi:predicted permease
MQAILSVTVPFFALILCGYLAARLRWLPDTAVPGLNGFVLFFALPCMLFRFGAGTPLRALLNPTVLVVYGLVGLLIVAGTVALTRSPRVGLPDAALGALVAAFPNSGFMGVPLLAALLGPQAVGPVMCSLLTDLFLTSSVCIALAQAHGWGGPGSGVALRRALRGPLTNPLPWAIALGALFSVLGLELPGPVATAVRMLADAATPVALFTIGAVLWRAQHHAGHRTPASEVWPVAGIKLFVHPLLVYAGGRAAQAAGAPLGDAALTALTLAAALPCASNVSLLAERYGADNGRIARIILASTVLSFGSFSLLAWTMGVRPA